MSDKSSFQDLARFMPEKEREDLLSKIQSSLTPEEGDEVPGYHKEIDKNERQGLLKKDIAKLPLFSRLLIWLRSKLSGKSFHDAFINYRLRRIKRRIQSTYPGVTGFETRDLNPKLAQEVFDLYTMTVPLRGIYQQMWIRPRDFERLFMSLLEVRIPEPKKTLFDFVPLERMEVIFAETGSKEALREEVVRELMGYIKGIQHSVYTQLEEAILPIAELKEIVLFQYIAFFQLFHFTPREGETPKKTYFKNASAMLSLKKLEGLYHALLGSTRLPAELELPDDLLAYMTMLKSEEEKKNFGFDEENGAKPDQMEGEGVDKDLDTFSSDDSQKEPVEDSEEHEDGSNNGFDESISPAHLRLLRRARELFTRIPILDLIRFFLKDPYYEIVGTRQELRLQDLYGSALRIRILSDLDQRFTEIQRNAVDKQVQNLFAGKDFLRFRNYRVYKSLDYEKMGLPFFSYTQSLTLLYNYVRWFYKGYIREGIQILERSALANNRITKDGSSHKSVHDFGQREVTKAVI